MVKRLTLLIITPVPAEEVNAAVRHAGAVVNAAVYKTGALVKWPELLSITPEPW